MLHLDTLGAKRKAFLGFLVDNLPVEGSYLAGGTALALILGHRESIDFDWFFSYGFRSGGPGKQPFPLRAPGNY